MGGGGVARERSRAGHAGQRVGGRCPTLNRLGACVCVGFSERWGSEHYFQCPGEQAMTPREVKTVIALPHHLLLQPRVDDLCFWDCDKGTPGPV